MTRRPFTVLSILIAWTLSPGDSPGLAQAVTGPLRVHPSNPRYFTDGTGKAVYLTGSHEWLNLVDGGRTDPPAARDYGQLMHFMRSYNHNFQRLWAWEQSKWICEQSYPFWFSPAVYKRTGPGLALDGKPKFNIDSLDESYFERLRQRVAMAGDSGVYTAVMLFDGWSIWRRGYGLGNPWSGHPFNGANNVNGVNADVNRNGEGEEFHTYLPAVWPYQVRYIRKVIDAVNDLDGVLYEVSNESPPASIPWQERIVDTIRAYQSMRGKQHPVGITGDWGIDNEELFSGNADWISPGDPGDLWRSNPPPATGSKVVIVDTDHLWGIGGDRSWVWKTFLRGHHPIYMDQYDGSYGWDPGFDSSNPAVVNTRKNMGYTLRFAGRVDLAAMVPRGDLVSTGYCLGSPASPRPEFIVYSPTNAGISMNLTGVPGSFRALWFNPANADTLEGGTVQGGGWAWLVPPFAGDAVVLLSPPGALASVPLVEGWNLVSLPLAVADTRPEVCFPQGIPGSFYSFTGGSYQQATRLVPGTGYWMRTEAPGIAWIAGSPFRSSVTVVPDSGAWVLIGGVSEELPLSALVSTPPDAIVPGTLRGREGGVYVVPTAFLPGRAYWVRVSTPCTLTLAAGQPGR
jgi:hypothetical protein